MANTDPEKNAVDAINNTSDTSLQLGRHPSRRLQIDDGKHIHVVDSVEHAEELRKLHSNPDFEFTIKGSDEHIRALNDAKRHHTRKADELRQQHTDAFNLMDTIKRELDQLSKDITAYGDDPCDVRLEANFDKFGYAANVRTHRTEAAGEKLREETTQMKLYRTPVIRQYFHKGVLWRASNIEEVASFELFVDLLFVGIIAVNGDHASEEATGEAFLKFCITFIPSWKIWNDVTVFVSWFDTDDVQERVGILFILACLVGYTINIGSAAETTYNQLFAFYVTARLWLFLVILFMSAVIPMVRPMMINNAICIIIPTALWIGTMFIDDLHEKLPLIWIAIVLDVFGSVVAMFLFRGTGIISKRLHAKMQKLFDFVPAVNIEHKTERTGAFVSLVFGYGVVAVLYQNKAAFGLNAFLGKAILGLVQAFIFNWIYFDIDGAFHAQHAIRRHAVSSLVWISAHLPFIMGFTIASAALSKLVLARDCANADLESLTEAYHEKSIEEVDMGLRWFYCGGLCIALLCMTAIAMSHVHRDVENVRIKKRYRMALRVAVAIVWVCLPVAGDKLNSLNLVSVTTGMIALVLIVDIYGTGGRGESFFDTEKRCEYLTSNGKKSKKGKEDSSGTLTPTETYELDTKEGMMDLS